MASNIAIIKGKALPKAIERRDVMFFWKIDEETIRCLINKEEIGKMGFDVKALETDSEVLEEFLQAVVDSSKTYIEWNTDNGIQNYAARALPAEQFLFTISCTPRDEAIDQDLTQIRKMVTALKKRISEERIEQIFAMTGEEKEEAFESLARDLHDICTGNIGPEKESPEDKEVVAVNMASASEDGDAGTTMPPQKIVFRAFQDLLNFCALLNESFYVPSALYKEREDYVLLVEFPAGFGNAQAISFLITAEEYGAQCANQKFDEPYLSEHATLLLKERAIEMLHLMNK